MSAPIDSVLERPYEPPELFIFEEVEIGGGYHTLSVAHRGPERDWSEPYAKSGVSQYRFRIVRVPYPPEVSADAVRTPINPERSWVLWCARCCKSVVTKDNAVCTECGKFVAPGREDEIREKRKTKEELPPMLRPCAICGEVSEHIIHSSNWVPSGRKPHAFVPTTGARE